MARRDDASPWTVVCTAERQTQLVQVRVEQRDVGAHAERMLGGVLPGHAGADDDRPGVGDAPDGRHQHAPAPCGRISACAPTCGARQPATSDIGLEERQHPGGQLHRP